VPAGWSLGHELKLAGNEIADLRNAGILTSEGQNFSSHHVLIPYLSHADVVQLRGRGSQPKSLPGWRGQRELHQT
jgi:hypothetical protein